MTKGIYLENSKKTYLKMSDSEQRKLIRFGNSSYIIALPKNWIDKNKLKKGDLIFLEETANNELVLSTKSDKAKETKSISLTIDEKDDTSFLREFNSAYINNYNEIIITGKDLNKKQNFISKLVQDKIGLEVSEQDANQAMIRDILDLEAISMDKIIRRLDNIVRSMFDDLREGITAGKLKEWTMNEIYNADKAINKFYFLSLKIVRKCNEDPRTLQKLKLDPRSIADAQWVVLHFEYIGDELKRMSKLLHSRGVINQKELMTALNAINEEYISMMSAFYNRDIKTARGIAIKKKNMMDLYEKLFFSKSKEVVRGTESMVEKLKSITGYVHNISRVIGY